MHRDSEHVVQKAVSLPMAPKGQATNSVPVCVDLYLVKPSQGGGIRADWSITMPGEKAVVGQAVAGPRSQMCVLMRAVKRQLNRRGLPSNIIFVAEHYDEPPVDRPFR